VVDLTDVRPGGGCVTGEAVGREAKGQVIHGLGGVVILPMTSQALRRRRVECSTLVIAVAALAAGLEMGSLQGKSCALVDAKAGNILEGGRGMAEAAIR